MGGVAVNWSEQLEELHEESSRTHFLDIWTRRAMCEHLGPLPSRARVADIGCSSGYLLEDLATKLPDARLFGLDGVFAGLSLASKTLASLELAQGDVTELPYCEESFDAILCANLLEHVADDGVALGELRRVLRPGGRAILVVPRGRRLFDYYDRFLCHERRYGHGEMAAKAKSAGFELLADLHLGAPLYPAFWLVKKVNRVRFSALSGDALTARVARDIAKTNDSRLGQLLCAGERRLVERSRSLPFGIRGLTVLRRPRAVR